MRKFDEDDDSDDDSMMMIDYDEKNTIIVDAGVEFGRCKRQFLNSGTEC